MATISNYTITNGVITFDKKYLDDLSVLPPESALGEETTTLTVPPPSEIRIVL